HNVVYHEFAHKLDMLDGAIDGVPPMASKQQYRRWNEICGREYERLRVLSEQGIQTLLDPYGATSVGEFFAVATEAFFDQGQLMEQMHPELYAVLAEFYRQDPAARARRVFESGVS